MSYTIQEFRNGLGPLNTVLTQGFQSLLETSQPLVDTLPGGVTDGILLRDCLHSRFLSLKPHDYLRDGGMMVANPAEELIVPAFTHIVSFGVNQSVWHHECSMWRVDIVVVCNKLGGWCGCHLGSPSCRNSHSRSSCQSS